MQKQLISIVICFVLIFSTIQLGIFTCASSADIIESGSCGENVKYTLDSEGVLTISGEGRMYGYGIDTLFDQKSIKKVIIENGVTYIGQSVFQDCTEMTSVIIPDSVTEIYDRAFQGCSSLKSLIIPNSVKEVGWGAFEGCIGVQSIIISQGVETIRHRAFFGCTGIKSVTIPNSVTFLTGSTFGGCTGLEKIEVSEKNPTYQSINNCIIEKKWKALTVGCKNSVIPNDGSVTQIADGAFEGCAGLKSVSIPDRIEYIGLRAFSCCTGLEKIEVSQNNPQYYSVNNCIIDKEYHTLVVGCKNSEIPNNENIISITGYAFEGCTGLKRLIIPDSVTSIGGSAFEGCTGLTTITIPAGVTKIWSGTFEGCTGLKNVLIKGNISLIDTEAFYGCTGLESINMPEGLTEIGLGAFRDCESLEKITIPNSTTYIGRMAFSGCAGLKSLTIGTGLKKILDYTFSDCSRITDVTIPENVTEIGDWAFIRCGELSSLTIKGGATIGRWAFCYCTELKSASLSKDIETIGEGAFKNCTGLTSFIIPESATSLEHSILEGCTSLESVTMSGNVKSVGESAFKGCSSLKNIALPDSVTSIGMYAFEGCSSLKSIAIPDSITTIESVAFSGCSSLNNIIIPDSVTLIGSSVFKGCTGLKNITLPDSISTLDGSTFEGCSELKNIIIPYGVRLIDCNVFKGCSALTSITIPDTVTEIGYDAFERGQDAKDKLNIYYSGTEAQWKCIENYDKYNINYRAIIHYESTGDPNSTFRVGIGYCSKSTEDIIVIDGVEYKLDPKISKIVFSGRYVKYAVDSQNTVNVLSFISSATGTFDDLDYNNKKITISGVTYNITEECLKSEAFMAFNASLYTRFGETITFFRDYDKDIQTVYAISFDECLTGNLTGFVVENGQTKAVIDGVKYVCAADCRIADGVKTSSGGQMVSCSKKDGRLTSITLYVKQNYGVYKQEYKTTNGSDANGYITRTAGKNRIIMDYANDVYKAADDILKAVKDGIGKKLKLKDIDDVIKRTSPENLAEQMKADDKAKKSANIVLTGLKSQYKKAEDAAYKALASVYIDYIYGNELDFSKVNVKSDSITFTTSMMQAVINGSKGTGTYNNIEVDGYTFNFHIWAQGGKYAGTIDINKSKKQICSGVISSNPDSVKETLDKYCKDLQKIVKDAINYAEYSFVAEFCDVIGLKDYTKEQVKSGFDSILRNLSHKEEDKLKKTLTQSTVDAVAEVAETLGLFKQSKSTFDKDSYVNPNSIIKLVERAQKLDFSYDDLLDNATKKAVEKMEKQLERLIRAFNDYNSSQLRPYTTLEDEKSGSKQDKVRATLKCPVDVEIYDNNGQLAGYVDSSESRGKYIWSNEDIAITVSGNEKTVVFPADKQYTLKALAYADGKMNYTIEHQYADGTAERLNYYDVPLTKGKCYEQVVPGNISLSEKKDNLALTSGNSKLTSNEFYSSDDDAAVKIFVSSGEGGSAESDIFYVKGSPVTLCAMAEDGYDFDGWYIGDELVSRDAVYRFTAREDLNLNARFKQHLTIVDMCIDYPEKYTEAISVSTGIVQDGSYVFRLYDINAVLAKKTLSVYGIKTGSATEELLNNCPEFDGADYYTFSGISAYYGKYKIKDAIVNRVLTISLDHNYDEWTVVTAATCSDTGVKTCTCTVCGATKTEKIDKLTTHTWNTGKVTKSATCKEEGVKTYTCTICGATKTEKIDKLTTHTWNTGKVTKSATCNEEGVKTYTCTVCGATKTEKIDKLTTHTWNTGKVTKSATCKEEGVKTYTCSVCGATKTEKIDKLTAHTWNTGKVTKSATCKEEGVKTYTCTVCGATKTEKIEIRTAPCWDTG